MVTIGIKGREEAVVLPELTAKHIGSGTVPVLATPMMTKFNIAGVKAGMP